MFDVAAARDIVQLSTELHEGVRRDVDQIFRDRSSPPGYGDSNARSKLERKGEYLDDDNRKVFVLQRSEPLSEEIEFRHGRARPNWRCARSRTATRRCQSYRQPIVRGTVQHMTESLNHETLAENAVKEILGLISFYDFAKLVTGTSRTP
jgi:hypothetical protein